MSNMMRFGRFAWIAVLLFGVVGAAPFYRETATVRLDQQEVVPTATLEKKTLPVVSPTAITEVKLSTAEESVLLLTEQKSPPPPLVQLPEWTNQPPPIVQWEATAPPPPPENPYTDAWDATKKTTAIVEPPRVTLKPIIKIERVKKHRVVDGDSLRILSLRYYGDESHMEAILRANQKLITHAELLPVGEDLIIPAAP
jgi:nucleoid-associated protein YgaU